MSHGTLDPYQRLAFAVILHGIREQNSDNISTQYGKTNQSRLARIQHRAREAKRWVNSKDFDWWCKLIDADPAELRQLSPAKAKQIIDGRAGALR